MTEQNGVDSAPAGEGLESDRILAEIEAQERQLESAGVANAGGKEPALPSGTDQPAPEPADKPSEPAGTSPDGVTPAPSGSDKADETEEWMKVKGFKSTDDIIHSYRNLERKLHGRGKVAPPVQAQQPAAPVYQPPAPESRPINPTVTLQELAQHYGAMPEDVQRVAMISRDVVSAILSKELQPLVTEVTGIKRETEKEKSFGRLTRDPLFQNRDVQIEMHKIAEEDPSILENPDYPERLFTGALNRIGRRFAENQLSNAGNPAEVRLGLPFSPPPSGRGSAGGPKGIPLKPPPTSISASKFENLSVAEMEKILTAKGALPRK